MYDPIFEKVLREIEKCPYFRFEGWINLYDMSPKGPIPTAFSDCDVDFVIRLLYEDL